MGKRVAYHLILCHWLAYFEQVTWRQFAKVANLIGTSRERVGQGCRARGPQAKFGPRSCFVWIARSFCEVNFLMERLTILWQIKKRSKPKPSSVWFSRNQFDFAAKTFFFLFFFF